MNARKQESIKIGDSQRYAKANAEEYLNNLTQTQYDFLVSIKNDKRSLSAFNTDAHPYQPTVFKNNKELPML